MDVHHGDRRHRQADHLPQPRAQPVVDQHPGVLRIILELYYVVAAVGAAHEMALRPAPHPAYVLYRLDQQETCFQWLVASR